MMGIIYALVAMLSFGLSNGIMRVPARKMSAIKNVFYRNTITSACILIVLLIVWKSEISYYYVGFAVFVSIVGFIPLMTFYKALEKSPIGVVSPIANSAIVFTVLFSVILFGESLSLIQIVSMTVIFIGIMLTCLDLKAMKKADFMKSGIPFALVTCVLWGLFFALSKVPVNVIGPILSAFIFESGNAVIAFFLLIVKKESFKVPKDIRYHLLFLGLFGAIAIVAYNMGLAAADISVVAAITLANPIVAVLYGTTVYKEKLSVQQAIAVAVTIAGIIMLSYFS